MYVKFVIGNDFGECLAVDSELSDYSILAQYRNHFRIPEEMLVNVKILGFEIQGRHIPYFGNIAEAREVADSILNRQLTLEHIDAFLEVYANEAFSLIKDIHFYNTPKEYLECVLEYDNRVQLASNSIVLERT